VKDIASLLETLRTWMAANDAAVKKVNLILGFGYDNSTLAEHRHPTRDDLDKISKDTPVLLVHQSGHLSAVNSKALEVLGITAATPDPQGGVIRRRKGSKDPDGVLEETAHYSAIARLLGQVGAEGVKAFVRAGADLWARFGYTTADEGRSIPATAAIMQQVADEGGFKIDVATYPDVLVDRDFIKQHVSPTYENRYRVAGAKLTIDGSRRASPPGATAPTTSPSGTTRRATGGTRPPRPSRSRTPSTGPSSTTCRS